VFCGTRRPSHKTRSTSDVFAGGAPGARTLNQRIKSFSGASSPGFISVRAAGQTAYAYPGELGWTLVNCNPNCNPDTGPVKSGWLVATRRGFLGPATVADVGLGPDLPSTIKGHLQAVSTGDLLLEGAA
jgi:hypothetical protein